MRLTYFFISGLAMTFMMSSCSSENDAVTTDNGNGLKTISLNFSAANLKTRATGDPADASKYIVGPKSTEARLSRLAVGIFNGTATSSINEISPDNTTKEANSTSYTASFNAQAAAGNDVYIVANAPENFFSGQTTLANFQKMNVLDLGYTTSADGNTNYTSGATTKQVQTALPMNCTLSTLTAGSGADKNKLVVTDGIAMKRLVARIAINSIKISIPSTGMYAGDTFTPTEVFVYNAATSIYPDGTTIHPTEPINSGESTKPDGTWTPGTTAPTMADNLADYSYLSTGIIFGFIDNTKETPTLSTTNQYYFYVFPHTAITPTKLVIKGTWYNSVAKTYEVVYYPIVINHSQTGTTITDDKGNALAPATDSQIDANMQYVLSAEIKAKGVSSPETNITPSAISVALTVTDWSVTNQNVVFE